MKIEVINCICNITQTFILIIGLILLVQNIQNRLNNIKSTSEANIREYHTLKQDYENLLQDYENLLNDFNMIIEVRENDNN